MKYTVKEYRVGEIAEYYGISPDTVRLYDRKGILPGGRNGINNYRSYTREDFVTMDYVVRMRRMGISLDDIRSIMNEDSLPDICSVVCRYEDELVRQIDDLTQKLKLLRDYEELLDICVNQFGKIDIITFPSMICREIRDGETMAEVMESFEMLNISRMPLLSLSCEEDTFDEKILNRIISIENREEYFDYFVSVIDEDGISERRDFPRDDFRVIPSRKYLFAVGCVNTDIDYSDILRVKDYVETNSVVLDGMPIYRLVANEYSSTNSVEYMELLIPVQG